MRGKLVNPAVAGTALATALLAGAAAALAAPGRPSRVVSRPAKAVPAEPVDFNRDIRPVLSKNCFACHGADEKKRAADLRLDLRDAATKVRGGRPAAVVPGAPDRSLLFQRITADEAHRMPPASAGPRLSPTEVAKLRAWVQQGAPYAQHWAFAAPRRPALPAVKQKGWIRNPIDAFVLARLEKAGLKPAPEADRFTLLRRVSLDLRGLPPTSEEVDAFARDTSPHAYEKAVDRFLADPAYGERWARKWLDLARYADSAGYGSDPLRLNIWPYRDWVINAFNRDMPYDEFTVEQIAGDLLPDATIEQKIATAFNRNTMTNTEGGTDREEFRVAAVRDRVDTTVQVWMGLTMGCAKCHSHKYDPITQKEYYRFFALFNQTADADRPDEQPLLQIPYAPVDEKIRQADAKISELKQRPAAAKGDPKAARALQDEIAKLEKSRPARQTVPVMVEVPPDRRRETHVLIKSNFLDPGEKVEPGFPAAFNPLPKDAPLNRLGVARWIVAPDNPLTARVAVNRFWARLFGAGLVETEEDFGTQGEPPSHPELLDWLAVTFKEGSGAGGRGPVEGPGFRVQGSGERPHTQYPIRSKPWSVKDLLRLIVTSATYRQSSRGTPEALAKDPRNRLLSHAPRYRLEAETVRDQALAISGLLSRKIGGPSVYPPQPAGLWQAAFNGQRTWSTSTGEDKYRRGLYTFWRRTVPYPSMAAFDAPSREYCVLRRARTNTPLQAFVTLNDPVYVEAAQALARRIVKEGGSTPEDRAAYGLRAALCRPADPRRTAALVDLFHSERERYARDAAAAKAMATDPLGPLPGGMDPAELAAWTVVANVLLNLDGVLAKG